MRDTRITWLASFVASVLFSRTAVAGEYFDPGLLQSVNGNATISDTTLLSQGYQPPGTYMVHIDVNGAETMTSNVRFELDKEKRLVPCLSFSNYQKLGVDMSKVNSKAEDNELKKACAPMEEQVPGTKTSFDFSKLNLSVNIPQTVLRDETLTGVPQEEWDDGLPALFNTYQLSGQQYIKRSGNVTDSLYANLRNGLNLGRWRYRNNATLNKDSGWQNITNYVETAIRALKSELSVGDASTSGNVFDALLIRGVQLNSDDDMIPDQLTGFASVIRGIAKSNARVRVRSNGYTIYERSVPPGPFVISDLSSVSSGGKLDVVITEADGSETHNTVSYSSVPQLLRTWQLKYTLAAGRYISTADGLEKEPNLLQAALSWGLPLNTTVYGGSQYHEMFKAFSVGVGLDMLRLGGVALDITRSKYRHDTTAEQTGDMVRLTYRNTIAETDTQIQLDNHYYFRNYQSFSDWADTTTLDNLNRKRREYNLTINQPVTDGHSFYTTLNRTENNDNTVSRMWQFGWNGAWKTVSFSLAYSMTRNESAPQWDKQLSITLSVPFNEAFPRVQPMVTYTGTSGLKGDLSNQLGVNGRVGDNDNLSWNGNLSYLSQPDQSDTTSSSLGINYRGRYGDMDATWNADRNQYVSWSASGSLLAHRHGITAGKYFNNGAALVAIPGHKDVPLNNGQNIMTDANGYTIVPDIRPYHRNPLSIDMRRASKALDFASTSTHVVPTKDAIVLAQFKAISGRKAVATLNYHGKTLPFGARAKIDDSDAVYYVGDGGQVYLNAAPDKGVLHVKWGDNETCSAPFTLPQKEQEKLPVAIITLECQ